METSTSVIWFSPTSNGLEAIQEFYNAYGWTFSIESLLENCAYIYTDAIILFDVTQFKEQSFEQIKAISTILPHIPILSIADSEHSVLVEQTLQAGAFDFFIGPLNSELLKNRIAMTQQLFKVQQSLKTDIRCLPHQAEAEHSKEIELAFMAFYDELTGLANRKLLFARLDECLKTFVPHDLWLAILYIDLDGFKEVNDLYTHKTGDWLLQQVAIRLKHAVRKQDTVARVGGDEFCILLSEPVHLIDLNNIAQRLIYQISSPYFYQDQMIKIGASLGISKFQNNIFMSHDLFNKADLAMYMAKKSGTGTYRIYQDALEQDIAKISKNS